MTTTNKALNVATGLETVRARVLLSDLTDAELGRMMRQALLTVVGDEAPIVRRAVTAEREAVATLDATLLTEARAARDTTEALPGFVAAGLEIAPFDTTANEASEIAPSAIRSPYNKARYRLKAGDALPKEITYGALAIEHERLRALVGAKGATPTLTTPAATVTIEAQEAPVKAKKAKKAKAAIVTSLSEADAAKVAALVSVGLSNEKALALLAL